MRAARLLWAKLVKGFEPEEPARAWRCARTARPPAGASPRRTSSTTSRAPASRRWPPRRATRRACTPTRSTRRSRCRPTSARASRATRSSICSRRPAPRASIDPWGGSYYVERLTHDLAHARAGRTSSEVEELGGMAKAIEAGLPKMRIEEAAARTQARIDSGRQTIVGVNKLPARARGRADRRCSRSTTRPCARRRSRACSELRASRDEATLQRGARRAHRGAPAASAGQPARAGDRRGARARRRVGEISDALEKVWGRHEAHDPLASRACTGARWARTPATSCEVRDAGRRVRASARAAGRASSSRRWARTATTAAQKVIATAFADLGFDVDIGPLFQTPEETARQAVENDVHVVGASSLAAGHLTLVPAAARGARRRSAARTS